jgi:NAD(P)-dependent dehydrogenase (short-subunit alcohol dehydrogenase family)
MKQVIVITGASSGFGALAARRLADASHTVYAGMRATTGRNSPQAEAVNHYAREHQVELRAIEMDVATDASCAAAIRQIIAEQGRLDVVVHNAGHMSFGPAEAFTPEQFAELYDVNVLSTQRVNRAALPQLRIQGKGLIVWVSSSSTRGGTPPYLSPYFAAEVPRFSPRKPVRAAADSQPPPRCDADASSTLPAPEIRPTEPPGRLWYAIH